MTPSDFDVSQFFDFAGFVDNMGFMGVDLFDLPGTESSLAPPSTQLQSGSLERSTENGSEGHVACRLPVSKD